MRPDQIDLAVTALFECKKMLEGKPTNIATLTSLVDLALAELSDTPLIIAAHAATEPE